MNYKEINEDFCKRVDFYLRMIPLLRKLKKLQAEEIVLDALINSNGDGESAYIMCENRAFCVCIELGMKLW